VQWVVIARPVARWARAVLARSDVVKARPYFPEDPCRHATALAARIANVQFGQAVDVVLADRRQPGILIEREPDDEVDRHSCRQPPEQGQVPTICGARATGEIYNPPDAQSREAPERPLSQVIAFGGAPTRVQARESDRANVLMHEGDAEVLRPDWAGHRLHLHPLRPPSTSA